MTDEKFNVYQIKAIEACFRWVKEKVDGYYGEKLDSLSEQGTPGRWRIMKEAVDNFDVVSQMILNNELEKVSGLQWQEIMLLVEAVGRVCGRTERSKQESLKRGLLLLVGMFRNRFPGEKWNPEEFRWTTVGDVGQRGLSPMLMAIAEL